MTPPSTPPSTPPGGVKRPTWVEIDLAALRGNVAALRRLAGPERTLFAVVKANAYGHGADLIAPAALDAGADRLAVASVNEGIALRDQGIAAPILVLGYAPPWQADDLLAHDLTATVYDGEVAQALGQAAASAGKRLTVHLKVDTGMHRLGIYPPDAPALLAALAQQPGLDVEGLYTHFSAADEADKGYSLTQLGRLTDLLFTLESQGLRPRLVHSANSAATLSLPAAHLNGVRGGIALYGLHPSPQTPLSGEFRPVLRWVARIAQVKSLQPGDPVSYGNTYVADRPRRVAVIPVGYADGFPRAPRHWGSVLIRGQAAAILGRVCMDQTVVDVSEIETESGEPVRLGEEVTLIGRQGQAHLSAEEVAARLGTINYEVVSRIMARVPRVAEG